jgi:hypothetical protein
VTTTNNPDSGAADVDGANGTANGSGYASASSVAALAREIEAMRGELGELLAIPARLDELASLVAQLAEATAAACPPSAAGVISWLALPPDATTAHEVLAELFDWLHQVYLRYPDAAAGLPECWLWHPDVVEELLWLQHAWRAAYHDEHAAVSLAGDWHDRYRPGVVRRITNAAGRCSLDNHQPRAERPPLGGAVAVPLADALEPIASWWATHRNSPGPLPTPEQLATAAHHQRPRGRR